MSVEIEDLRKGAQEGVGLERVVPGERLLEMVKEMSEAYKYLRLVHVTFG